MGEEFKAVNGIIVEHGDRLYLLGGDLKKDVKTYYFNNVETLDEMPKDIISGIIMAAATHLTKQLSKEK